MNWEVKEINDLFLVTDYVANGSFASLKENVSYLHEKDFAILIRTTDNTKGWNENYIYVDENSYNFLSKSTVFPKDLIISNVGDPGKAFLCPDLGQPMTLGPNSILVRPLDKNVINVTFFYYYTCSKFGQNQIQEICSATAQKKFNKTSYRKLKVPLPPLEDQKKIAAILDAADDYRKKTKVLIEKYDQLTQSLFLDMFGDPVTNPKGWDYRKLSDISRSFIGLTYKPENVHSKGIIVLRSSNVQDFKLSFDDIVRVSLGVKEKLLVKPNDILMCTRNGSAKLVGKVALIGHEEEPMTFGAFMTIIRSDYYMYLMSYFKSPGFRRQIVTGATTTVNQITKNMLDRVELPLPPMRFQEHFAEKVAQIENQKQQAEASLVKAEELFNSLLQRAFNGELTN